MCGIVAIITRSETIPEKIWQSVQLLIQRRGPDSTESKTLNLGNGYHLHMISSVLHLRGDELRPQPYTNVNGDVLQWNGEIFDGLEVPENKCDTTELGDRLATCKDNTDICHLFEKLHGPYAFVSYHNRTKTIWFGKDYFGRRSLLWQKTDAALYLASTTRKPEINDITKEHWHEVQADGLYMIDTNTPDIMSKTFCHPWQSITQPAISKNESMTVYDPNYSNKLLRTITAMNPLREPKVCSPIKPFPVFTSTNSELEVTQMSSLEALIHICDGNNIWSYAKKLVKQLKYAVKKRVSNVPKRMGCSASVSVLFSGGIDCTVLALLANEFIPISEPIDLLNVAFKSSKSVSFDVPDRITGKSSHEELKQLCPNRKWNFVEINIGLEELQKKRKEIIADLTYPLTTVLDDSIGCALWFAARGESLNYKSDSKVLLCGMGADEQLGGYSRHRSAFEERGWLGLDSELKMEIERISSRNLCRDDRVTADHGKEARFPYLDESVVSFLNETPLSCKADLRYGRGVGEKILLRSAAYLLGLHKASVTPKRAIQFGSRIAKAECKKEKASDICTRLRH